MDSLRALSRVDLTDRMEFYLSLRTVLTSRVEDLPIFDEEFERFFGREFDLSELMDEDQPPGAADQAMASQRKETVGQERQGEGDDEGADDDSEPVELAVYSPLEVLAEKSFASFQADEMEEMARLIAHLARILATRTGRRMRAARRGTLIDPRRTVRQNIKYGGDIVNLAYRKRKIKKPRLVLICDVSRSMDVFSRFLLQFIYALQTTIGSVESFVFSTSLTRVTPYFKNADILEALDEISHDVKDWSGGTRIGLSLQKFNETYARHLVTKRSIVIILSDGLDTGDVDILEQAMQDLQRRARSVIWLNPLLGSKDYRPVARGMSTALPYVDVFAPAHNLASLRDLEKHLVPV